MSSRSRATQPPADSEGSSEPTIYLPMDCPVCGRHRVEWDGSTLRCEKCTTSSEWDGFTVERYEAHLGHLPEPLSVIDRFRQQRDEAEARAATPVAESGLREALTLLRMWLDGWRSMPTLMEREELAEHTERLLALAATAPPAESRVRDILRRLVDWTYGSNDEDGSALRDEAEAALAAQESRDD